MTNEQELLFQDNFNLVHSVANRLKSAIKVTTFEYEDLVNIGVIALIKAARTFRVTHEAKFSSYAYIIIKRDMVFEINKDSIRLGVPKHLLEAIPKLKCDKSWRELGVKEVAKRLNVPESRAERLLTVANIENKFSFDQEIKEDYELGDLLGKESDFGRVIVNDFLSTLEKADKKLIMMKLSGYKQREIAKRFNSSPQAINQRLKLRIKPRYKHYYAEV